MNGSNAALNLAHDMWKGRVHMHTAFWVGWVIPIVLSIHFIDLIGLTTSILMTPYFILAFVSAWRSTYNPPGRLWVPNVYRLFLGVFVLSVVATTGLTGYIMIAE